MLNDFVLSKRKGVKETLEYPLDIYTIKIEVYEWENGEKEVNYGIYCGTQVLAESTGFASSRKEAVMKIAEHLSFIALSCDEFLSKVYGGK